MQQSSDLTDLESRPGIFIVGSPSVGKRTLLSRLLCLDIEDAFDSPSQVFVHGWTINTKYYTADVSVWMAHLTDEFSIQSLPICNKLAALIMVYDLSDLSTLVALQQWVCKTDIQKFDILLCIGNKVDRVSGHWVHAEYRKKLNKSYDAFEDATEYGISETEGSRLLVGEEPNTEIGSCLEWCCEHNIEFIEACASDAAFDKCLSVNGDSQGVERLFGALSAHMWPGMVLKSGDKITEPILHEKEELSEEESDYDLEYTKLSDGLSDPWDDDSDISWISANNPNSFSTKDCFPEGDTKNERKTDNEESESSTPKETFQNSSGNGAGTKEEAEKDTKADKEETPFEFEELEHLMYDIGNMRDSLRLAPDFQRREIAAKLAMKMASMFGGGSDDEDDHQISLG